MKLLGIHGIDTPPASAWADDWTAALGVEVTPLRWDSTGKARDLWHIATSPAFRRAQVSALLQQIIDHLDEPRLAILAHSQGTVWMGRVLRALAATSVWRSRALTIPVVFMGSPLHHPVYGGLLETVGLGGPYPATPLSLYNDGDPVCAPWWGKPIDIAYVDAVRIAIAGDGGDAEHMQYWQHPYTQQAVLDALTYGRWWDK